MASSDDLAARFRAFAADTAGRAPLYAHLAAAIADDPELAGLLQAAPPEQRTPVLLFAAVHHLVLAGLAPALARHYPNLTPDAAPSSEAAPEFRRFVLDHRDRIRRTLATRRTQTNEVGRCATFLPALGVLHREVGDLALVDVGASAGLNLCLDRYAYTYRPGGSVGNDSPVHVECGTRGEVPVPARFPTVSARLGLDAEPVDVMDDDQVRWLEACVWPDQADRFDRLRAAITVARHDPPTVRRGDAVDDLAATVQEVDDRGHPVVMNSWVLSYLSAERRVAYVAELDRLGAERDLSWVLAESPAQTPGLPVPTTAPPEHRTVLCLVTWRSGRRTVRRLATCHPHGYWLHWA